MHAVQSAQKNLHNITLPAVAIEEYYAIDYLSKYYIGRTLSIANNLVKFKFLHRVLDQYVWRGRDDIEEVHMSCIFFGPIALKGTLKALLLLLMLCSMTLYSVIK